MVSFTRAGSPLLACLFTSWHHRSQYAKLAVGVQQAFQSKLQTWFYDSTGTASPPPSESMDTSDSSSTNPNVSSGHVDQGFEYPRRFAEDWYAALLQSVRQRRAGPISRTTSPVLHPTAVLFSAAPPMIPNYGPPEGAPESMVCKVRPTY